MRVCGPQHCGQSEVCHFCHQAPQCACQLLPEPVRVGTTSSQKLVAGLEVSVNHILTESKQASKQGAGGASDITA